MHPATPEIHVSPSALSALAGANEPAAINAALSEICASLDMQRYVAIRTRGLHLTRVTQVLHNVPEREAGPLESGGFWANCTALHGLLSGQPPFTFSQEDEAAPFIPAPGFSSGVAAACVGQRDACVLVFGRKESTLNLKRYGALRALALYVATYTSGPMALLPSAACPLTDRQLDCLRLAAAGYTSKQVGQQLGISFRTVDTLLAQARTRLGVDNTFAAGMAALDYGWITMDQQATQQQATG